MTFEERKEGLRMFLDALEVVEDAERKIEIWNELVPEEVRKTDPALEILFHFTTNAEFRNTMAGFVWRKVRNMEVF